MISNKIMKREKYYIRVRVCIGICRFPARAPNNQPIDKNDLSQYH